jgi:hypothetical protein
MVFPTQPTSSSTISHRSSASFPTTEKKEENREIDLKNKSDLLSLRRVISLSLLFHGGVELARVEGYTRAPTKPHESGVYDCNKVSYLLCVRGSCISCSDGGIRRGVHVVLRAGIWCAITSISPLPTVVIWFGAASLDSFRDPAYGGLRDPVRGLHWG